MNDTDLQLGGGYTYQWECAILLALNHFFEPVRYNRTLFDLINGSLGGVEEIHLEGEDRESGIDLEDINLINDDRRILIQVKTKQAEGERWTLSDPLLLKALYRFYDSQFLADRPEETRFVFLTNRPFNPDLVAVMEAIREGDLAACDAAERLGQYLCRYARSKSGGTFDATRFREMLARTRFVEYLAVDEIKANVQAKLQAHGRSDWERAHAVLFEHFARRSTRVGGASVTRAALIEVLGPPAEPSPAPQPPVIHQVNTGGAAYIGGNVVLHGGDFVSGDQTKARTSSAMESRPTSSGSVGQSATESRSTLPGDVGQVSIPADRPAVPSEGEPLALLAATLEARRLLLVWAAVPFPPQERLSDPPALVINRWQEAASGLPGTPFDFAHGRPWPLTGLPPLSILSLDPSDRLERAFRYAGTPLEVVCTQADVPARERHTLLKLGGDLDGRTGLLLDWGDVRQASEDPDKAHLLRGGRRVARDGAVLALVPSPDDAVARMWRELVDPAVRGAKHHFVLGPAGFAWPEPLTRLEGEVEEVLSALADAAIPPPLEDAPE